jgi:hypothetical protein
MRSILLLFLLAIPSCFFAQTWSDDVANIFYNKCGQCHHSGGIAPISLMSYSEVSPIASFIYGVVDSEEMPPWPPDNNYQNYLHKRSLSATEKSTILSWITNGAQEGNAANTPPPPVYPSGSLLGNGDLVMQIPTYMSKAQNGNDDYVCIVLNSNLPTARKIKAVEIVPGNREIVHHALVFLDPTGNSVTDTIGGDCASPNSNGAELVMGYTPGSSPLVLPTTSPMKLGIPMAANSQVMINLHYPDGSYGMYDSTKVIFHFYPPGETGIRDVITANVLSNWSFYLPPNQLTTVSAQYPAAGGLPANVSLLSVFPHMHLLGKSMEVFGVGGQPDTLKLINIPEWDFHWQDFYFFTYVQKAVTGMTLKARAVFDNTTNNPENPNNPPIGVSPGLNTNDEMMLVYAHYMYYQAGDENYNLDSLMSLSLEELLGPTESDAFFTAYPNPFDEQIHFVSKDLKPGDQLSVRIYDLQGHLVRILANQSVVGQGSADLRWDGKNEDGGPTGSGIYFVSINVNGNLHTQRIVKR